jgi:hypothetical protein
MVAAWMVAPGFYDGFGPPQPYNWTCPPAQAGANIKPSAGHLEIKVVGGVSDANSVFTQDGQVVIGFLPGAFDSTGLTTISVDITPLSTCSKPAGIQFVTNIYQISASAPLRMSATLLLRYSNLEPAPSDIYLAGDPSAPWKSIGAQQQSQPFTIVTKTSSFGYFAAGYPSASPPPGVVTVGGGQILPIVVAALIVLVVLAGVPLAMLRRRRARQPDEEDAHEDEA